MELKQMDSAKLRKYVRKELQPHVELIFRDSDGYWAWLDDEYIDPITEAHTVHEDTLSEFRKHLKMVEKEAK